MHWKLNTIQLNCEAEYKSAGTQPKNNYES